MTDGRVLIGAFLCTDRDANVILGSCSEFLSEDHTEARTLGLVMIPGRHIVTIHLDAWATVFVLFEIELYRSYYLSFSWIIIL